MVGLARRHDTRVVAPLLADIAAGEKGKLVLEAACEIADRPLLGPLRRLRGRPDVDASALEEAIAACAGLNGDGSGQAADSDETL